MTSHSNVTFACEKRIDPVYFMHTTTFLLHTHTKVLNTLRNQQYRNLMLPIFAPRPRQ